MWSSRSSAQEKSASSNRRHRFRPSSGNAYRVAFGLPGDVPPEDASRTYPNVVSQFVHVQSVRIHHLERSLRRRLVLQLLGGEFAAFVTPSKRIAAEHGAPRIPPLRKHEPARTLAPHRRAVGRSAKRTDQLRDEYASIGRAKDLASGVGDEASGHDFDVANAQFGDAPNDPRRRRAVARGRVGRRTVGR